MIQEMQIKDIERVMDIWLTTNIQAHSFIEEKFWIKHYKTVKNKYLKIAKTFVYEQDGAIVAFMSILNNSYIGALFVLPGCQKHKIGSTLINYAKEHYPKLEVHAYTKNELAVHFYKKHGFDVDRKQENIDTHFSEYVLTWQKADR